MSDLERLTMAVERCGECLSVISRCVALATHKYVRQVVCDYCDEPGFSWLDEQMERWGMKE